MCGQADLCVEECGEEGLSLLPAVSQGLLYLPSCEWFGEIKTFSASVFLSMAGHCYLLLLFSFHAVRSIF